VRGTDPSPEPDVEPLRNVIMRAPTGTDGWEAFELWVARRYGVSHRPNEAEWYDCRDPSSNTKYEAKTCQRVLSTGVPGRFRVWKDQLERLEDEQQIDGRAGWVVFGLLESDGERIARYRRMQASTVLDLVEDRGGFNAASHEERDSRQHKLPWEAVF